MEAFSLLKFWRLTPTDDPSPDADATNDAPTQLIESDDETSSEDSFFDLEFTLPGQDSPKKDADSASSDFVESPNNVFDKSDSNAKPQSPISFLRSPPKFKVLMFFKKPNKLDKAESTTPNASPSTPSRFAVKCDVEELPIWSLLNRVNSTRTKLYKKSSEEDLSKGFTKGGVQKYLKLIKPLYVSSDEKVLGSDPTSSPAVAQSKQSERKQGSKTMPLRVAGKLGKSRSASSAVGVVPVSASKRDDSLVLQQDGIQGAILHCKKSYNNDSSRGLASETSGEKDEEKKRSSI